MGIGSSSSAANTILNRLMCLMLPRNIVKLLNTAWIL